MRRPPVLHWASAPDGTAMPARRASAFPAALPVALVLAAAPAAAQAPALDEAQLAWLGERIFQNECGGRPRCLTSWNEGEDFPSLGIGHFIWYRAGQRERFEESFPRLLAWLADNGAALPAWLGEPLAADNPWADRGSFYADFDGPRMTGLRRLLEDTRGLQARFIARRLTVSADEIARSFPAPRRERAAEAIRRLAESHPPLGLYALIDYLHFKGSGLLESERYRGRGWGLKQVLEELGNRPPTLERFVESAEAVLRRRVDNAPPERGEARWLEGWTARLRTYLPPG